MSVVSVATGETSLDAAGITDPALRADYQVCRRMAALHGRSYYLATGLLPASKRPHVWALYGFARYADELVDSLTAPDPDLLVAWGSSMLAALETGAVPATGPVADAVGRAMLHTVRRWDIPTAHVAAFLASMRADIVVHHYDTYAQLREYMYGSAAVIGLQMLPLLEPLDPRAAWYAGTLGEAFQLSNFVRDVGEDLDRGRVYLPMEDLDAFGVTTGDLRRARRTGEHPQRLRDLLAFESDRARGLYAAAEPGIALLHPTSRDAIGCAFALYLGILDAVAAAGFAVVHRRVAVGLPGRARVAVPALLRASAARREAGRWRPAPA